MTAVLHLLSKHYFAISNKRILQPTSTRVLCWRAPAKATWVACGICLHVTNI